MAAHRTGDAAGHKYSVAPRLCVCVSRAKRAHHYFSRTNNEYLSYRPCWPKYVICVNVITRERHAHTHTVCDTPHTQHRDTFVKTPFPNRCSRDAADAAWATPLGASNHALQIEPIGRQRNESESQATAKPRAEQWDVAPRCGPRGLVIAPLNDFVGLLEYVLK